MGPGEVPLAQCQAGVLWSVSGGEGSELFRSALPLPSLGRDEGFHMLFNGDRFLELLPLLHYLRRAVRGDAFDGPPLRAWRARGAISRPAKIASTVGMVLGLGVFALTLTPGPLLLAAVALVMILVSGWIWLRPA